MKERKIRTLRYVAITVLIALTGCIFLIFKTPDNRIGYAAEEVSSDNAITHVIDTTTINKPSGSRMPSIGKLWSRSEVFMY